MKYAASNSAEVEFANAIEGTKGFLERVAEVEFGHADLNVLREKTIDLLLEHTGSVIGFWAMGHGHPMRGQVAPLAWIPRGVPSDQYGAFLEFGLSPLADNWVRKLFIPCLRKHKQVCHSRSQFHSDEVWQKSELVTKYLHPLGIENWMIAVRYPSDDIWSSLTLFRASGRPDYTTADRVMLDIVLASKSWLHYRLAARIGAPQASELSGRNATVLLMLLDGCSRKKIASQLNLSVHVVNDSIKAIYRHFGTSSATELAARFLKSI